MDYKGLNKSIIKKKYSLRIFDELVDHLSGVKKYSKIDSKT